MSEFERATATIAIPYLQSLVAALARMGVSESRLLASVGVSSAALAPPNERVPAELHYAIWRAAKQLTGDPLLGLHVGEQVTVGRWGTLEHLLLTADSLRHAMERAARYWQLVSDDGKMLALEESGDVASIVFDSALCDDPSAFESDMVYTLRLVRQLLDPRFVPSAIRFRHAPQGPQSEYVRVFGVVPEFGGSTQAFTMPRALVDVRTLGAGQPLSRIAERQAEAELAAVAPTIRTRVERAIASELRLSTLESVARGLGMSARSLQRHLASEGLTFRELLDEAKRREALYDLCHTSRSIAEIGDRLGFADASAFSQAARRWFETSPAELRRRAG